MRKGNMEAKMEAKMKAAVVAAVAIAAGAAMARETPISGGRLVNALNANQQMITNLPDAFWDGHGGSGGITAAVATNIAEAVTRDAINGVGQNATNYTDAVGALVAAAATNYTDAVVAALPVGVPSVISNAAGQVVSADLKFLTGEYTFGEWNPSSVPDAYGNDMYFQIGWNDLGFTGWYCMERDEVTAYPVSMQGDSDNPNATTLKFPDGTVTTRTKTPITSRLALTNDVPTASQVAAWDAKAETSDVAAVKTEVDQWETYWQGDIVRLSVTNYYGNTSGEPPRLRIEEFDHSVTSTVDGVDYVTNVFKVVWDEVTRQTNYYAKYEAKVNAISNNTLNAAYKQTYLQLANKAPRAWGDVTSSGEDAPANTVWHTAPNTVFAGGTEYAHVAVGEGQISVLVNNGAAVYTEGEEGQFRFKDDSGANYFGFDVREAYTLGCRTDGISVQNQIVTLTYDLTSASTPEILTCTDLLTESWSPVSDVTWEENPPSGTQICYINVGSQPKGFYKAQISYAGGSKFVTNMQADLAGGIAASNETDNVIQSVEPYIKDGTVYWRVKQ